MTSHLTLFCKIFIEWIEFKTNASEKETNPGNMFFF